MDSTSFITRIEQAGFSLALNGDKLRVTPASKLSDPQREFIATHRDELIHAIRLRDLELEASQSGNDHQAANDERALIHVPDFAATDGRRYSFDMTVPKANLERLRQVVRFKLIDNQGGGSILGEPGKSRDELVDILRKQYADRLETIDDIRYGSIEREEPSYPEGNPEMMRRLREINSKQAAGQTLRSSEMIFLQAIELCRQEDMSQHGGQVIEGECVEANART